MGELWFSPSTLKDAIEEGRLCLGEVYLKLIDGKPIDGEYYLSNAFVSYPPFPKGHPIPEDSLFLGIDMNGMKGETCKHIREATIEDAKATNEKGLIVKKGN